MAKIYLLSDKKYQGVENLEVFKIEYINSSIELNKYDAIIFTSKNAIYSLDSFNNSWKNIPSYAIAKKTADIVKKFGGFLVYTGISSHGDDFAKELIPLLKNKKVLYAKALKTVSNLSEILKLNNILVDEVITYKTVCNDVKKELEKESTFIFTSPSSIECFFKQYPWDKSFKAVCIGKTTTSFLPSYCKSITSPITSIDECIKLAKNISF